MIHVSELGGIVGDATPDHPLRLRHQRQTTDKSEDAVIITDTVVQLATMKAMLTVIEGDAIGTDVVILVRALLPTQIEAVGENLRQQSP